MAQAGLEEKLRCESTVEDLGPCRKKLNIKVPADSINDQLSGSIDTLANEAVIPGFRAGRAPRRLVEKKFGSTVRKEAKSQIVATAFTEAVEEHGLKVIGDPEPEEGLEELEVEPGREMTFSVTVEVTPEFELPKFEDLTILKPLFEASAEDADRYIERLGMNEGSLEHREKAEPGDYVIGHGIIRDSSGTVQLDIPDAVVQRPAKGAGPEGQILGIKVADFADQIGTPKKGDLLKVKATGPDSHENEALRGEALEIELNIEQVQRIVPQSPEQLVSHYGLESEQQLREMVMLRLNQRAMVDQQALMRRQVSQHLIDGADFELPERITDRQAARNIERARLELLYRGVDESEIESNLADIRASSEEVAQRELKLFFILQSVSMDMNLEVTEQEILGRIAQMAAERGQRPEQLRKELVKRKQIPMLEQQIREHKALDAVLSKATIRDVAPDALESELESIWGEEAGSILTGSSGGAAQSTGAKTTTTTRKTTKKAAVKKASAKKGGGKKAAEKKKPAAKKSSKKKKTSRKR